MAIGYISRKAVPLAEIEQALGIKLAAQEEELRRAYALLWQKQAALDAASSMVSELTARLQTQQRELEILRSAHDSNSPL